MCTRSNSSQALKRNTPLILSGVDPGYPRVDGFSKCEKEEQIIIYEIKEKAEKTSLGRLLLNPAGQHTGYPDGPNLLDPGGPALPDPASRLPLYPAGPKLNFPGGPNLIHLGFQPPRPDPCYLGWAGIPAPGSVRRSTESPSLGSVRRSTDRIVAYSPLRLDKLLLMIRS